MGAHSRTRTGKSHGGSTPPSARSPRCWRPMTVEQPRQAPGHATSQVTVTINGRQFRMACEDGQEAHLRQLAADFDDRIEKLRRNFGEIGDTRLTVMAALTLADELTEMGDKLRGVERELAALQDARVASAERAVMTQEAVAAALNAAAERIESITQRLNQTRGDIQAGGKDPAAMQAGDTHPAEMQPEVRDGDGRASEA